MDTDLDKLFWEASVDALTKGYVYVAEHQSYCCLLCGALYLKGVIYPSGSLYLEAKRAVQEHITTRHGSVFSFLLGMDKRYLGLTDHQQQLLAMFYEGLSDKEIIKKLGEGRPSTIRNHRFRLKEKAKQARVFLALMAHLDGKIEKDYEWVNVHKGATMVDGVG